MVLVEDHHQDLSNENALSYHRLKDQCTVWKNSRHEVEEVLKMYTMFNQSDSKAINDILKATSLSFTKTKTRRPLVLKGEMMIIVP